MGPLLERAAPPVRPRSPASSPGDANPPLGVEEVTTAEGLDALRSEWSALWEASPGATPFQTPEWMLAWWRRFGGEGLWTLALRDGGGRLAGLAPLFVWRGAGARQVTLVGNGISDRPGPLALPGLGSAAAAAVLGHLAANRDRWDTADLRDLPADSPLLATPIPGSIAAETEAEEPNPVLPLPDRVEDLADSPAGERFGRLAYYRRRAEREGGLVIEAADEANLGAMLDDLFRLHGARWRERGEPGVLDDEGVRAFHREAAAALLARGVLRMYAVRVGGRTAAVHYGFGVGGGVGPGFGAGARAWYYLGGFDPAFDKLSPGHLAVGHAIEQAIREGAREFDFLRGRERYKYAWGATDRAAARLRLRAK